MNINSLLASIYSGYEKIYFVHRDTIGLAQVSDVMKVNEDSINAIGTNNPMAALFGCPRNSLVVIDVNSVGTENTDYYLFLMACLFPGVATVLIANDLPEKTYKRYLASSVVAIIQGAEPNAVAAIA